MAVYSSVKYPQLSFFVPGVVDLSTYTEDQKRANPRGEEMFSFRGSTFITDEIIDEELRTKVETQLEKLIKFGSVTKLVANKAPAFQCAECGKDDFTSKFALYGHMGSHAEAPAE